MSYIIIENFNETIFLVLDEEGKTFVTEDLNEAITAAKECQNGIIIELPRKAYCIL